MLWTLGEGPSRGLLRDCTTGCGTDGSFYSNLKIDNFILKRILIYSHDLPNQQQLHKSDDSIITMFRAEHVPYHSDYLGLTLASADGLTVMMTQ